MSANPDVVSTTDTPKPDVQPKAAELKSIDTGVLKTLKADTASSQPKADKPEDKKPATDATPAVKGADADSSEAEHQDDDRKIEPWMRKRLSRAEEKGRKQASAEILETIRTLRAPPAQPGQQPSTDGKPQPSDAPKALADFDYDVEKFTQYQIREGVKTALAERDAEADKTRKQQAAEESRNAFERRKAEFEKRVGEGAWDEMIAMQVDVPQEIIDVLMGHPKDLDIAHHLVNNPQELEKLKGKSKLDLAIELKAIEAKLSSGGKKEVELPPKTTKAPPLADELPSGTKSSKSVDEMTTAERIAHWRTQKASKGR